MRIKTWWKQLKNRVVEYFESRRDAKIWGKFLYDNDLRWPLGDETISPAHRRVRLIDWLLFGTHRSRLLAKAIYKQIPKPFRARRFNGYVRGLKKNRGKTISNRERKALLELRDALKKYL